MTLANLTIHFRLAAAEYALKAHAERKANFNPAQPRIPRGNAGGGRWTRIAGEVSDAGGWLSDEEREEFDVRLRAQRREVQQFMYRNRETITRIIGGLQMAGGTAEMLAGVTGVVAGVASSQTGVGVAVAGVSASMVQNGYDNFATGWRALTTGNPQQTNLHTALRSMGLSEDQATATEILLAGGVGVGSARLTNAALREAAMRGLGQRTLAQFADEPLNVRAGALRVWDEPNIQVRGAAWEVFDAQRTGFERTPPSFRVFDQWDRASETAISNKTLDLALTSYSRTDRNAVYNILAGYVDSVAAFRRDAVGDVTILGSSLRHRRLHVLFPYGEVLPGQALQIAAAEQYAAQRGVILQVEYAR